jgi:hypothetical protein
MRCLAAADKIDADASEIEWLRQQRKELDQKCFQLREVNADMFQALQTLVAAHDELLGPGMDGEELKKVRDDARAALSKARGIDTTETD